MTDNTHPATAMDLTGRNVVITGASDGIGKTAARRLAVMGAHVVIVGRNAQKTETVVREIDCARVSGTVTSEIADLSRQDEVRELANRLRARLSCIDVLINNAGAIFSDRVLTSDGFERTFALNHLGYFTLTLLLLPALYAAGVPGRPARIINVASRAHFRAQLDLNDLQSERSFRAWRTYNNSKLANILFTRALSRRLDTSRVVTHSLHPGVVASQFAIASNGFWGKFMRTAMNLRSISPERGADTIVHLATAHMATLTSGLYWDQCTVAGPSAAAQNDANAERLWVESARLASLEADRITETARNDAHANDSPTIDRSR
ncbi:MAG: SDR family NAD(P)-dependent oxidoreductase [Gemmatimonadaceae bacterium]